MGYRSVEQRRAYAKAWYQRKKEEQGGSFYKETRQGMFDENFEELEKAAKYIIAHKIKYYNKIYNEKVREEDGNKNNI